MSIKNKNIYDLLFEQDKYDISPEESMNLKSTGVKARKALDSIDDQVDALILRYEASSIRDSDDPVEGSMMESSLFAKSLKFLFEQEEAEEVEDPVADDTAAPAEGDAAAGEEEAPEPVGSEKMDVTEPGEEEIPDLDIDAFATRTVRLIMNYKNLLRVEEAIINRIKHFLDENYGDQFVTRYLEILDSSYGIDVDEFAGVREEQDDDFAVGAFAGGTGGLGGGG